MLAHCNYVSKVINFLSTLSLLASRFGPCLVAATGLSSREGLQRKARNERSERGLAA
jgi:hypothetical protein